MYEKLHANIPTSLMEFANFPFPTDGVLFPDREEIHKYLERYGKDVKAHIRFGWRVDEVRRTQNTEKGDPVDRRWRLKASHLSTGRVEEYLADAVVMANGHYSVPYVPDIPGLAMFDTISPDTIHHSMTYRSAEAYRGLRTVVVGNGPSGLDIARQVAATAAKPLYLSARTPTDDDNLAHLGDGVVQVPAISRFLPDSKGVGFGSPPDDGDSVELHEVDRVVMCTGYMYNYAMLPDIAPKLLESGHSVHRTYRHVFYASDPTLVFPALPRSVVPFPLAESQAAIVAGAWANDITLPPQREREAWCDELEKSCERESDINRFWPGQNTRYINEFYDMWAESGGHGKEPPYWGPRKTWERSIFMEAKIRFEKTGCVARSLEELGFSYPGEENVKEVEAQGPVEDGL
jgi:hypothetical protein